MKLDDLAFESAADAPIKECLRQIHTLNGVNKVYLYGSYAKGTNRSDSDIDLAVFYDLPEKEMLESYRELAKICTLPEADIQVQAFSLCELADPCGIFEEIINYGEEIDF